MDLKTIDATNVESELSLQAQPNARVLAQSARFVRTHAVGLIAISALILAPCFWHRRIAASDLGSHLYNAWLAHLIRPGQAPGLGFGGSGPMCCLTSF